MAAPGQILSRRARPPSSQPDIVELEWLFDRDNRKHEANDPEDAVEFWETTNRQDWDIIERSELGIHSRRYQPGPYSARESIPAAWDREYLRQMGRL